MMEKRTNLEVIAPSIEEAIDEGLEKLGLSEEEVLIEILDEGTKGLFGLGSRQARVLLTIKGAPDLESEVATQKDDSPEILAESENSQPDIIDDSESEYEEEMVDEVEEIEEDQVLKVAHDVVSDLLNKMKVNASVTASYADEDEYHGQKPVLVDIHGNDLSILIGRKAETLNALQYITNLIIGKEMGRSIPLSIDIEGYRNRRNQQLKQIANRLAEQVIQTNRSQSLEPMPASERRIIHIELRDHPEVYTESTGEGDRRKVVIYPK